MAKIGTIESVWRYPVKSMRGEELDEIFAGFAGVYGDRLFAFSSSANRVGFPFLTPGQQRALFLCRPRFRHPENAIAPINLAEAERIAPGATPLHASAEQLALEVETPDDRVLAIDDPALLEMLRAGLGDEHHLTLLHSERAFTDCRPLSIFSLQTLQQLSKEMGAAVDPRRFRANIYLNLESGEGFAEDRYVGRSLRLGEKAVVAILERDPRCATVAFNPDTGDREPAVLKHVVQKHNNNAGVYAAVLVEGIVRRGDAVELID